MSHQSDSKKRKAALPSILSNLRNAHDAIVGRAASVRLDYSTTGDNDLHDRETRPLTGSANPQLHRAPPSSFSASLNNFSQHFGSQWRKRRKKGQGVTAIPQSFYYAVGCFFCLFPIVFLLYILSRHAVFGDEGRVYGAHVHEVPTSFAKGAIVFGSGEEDNNAPLEPGGEQLLENAPEAVVHNLPEDVVVEGVVENVENPPVNEGEAAMAIDPQMIKGEEEGYTELVAESALTNELQTKVNNEQVGESDQATTGGEVLDNSAQNEGGNDHITVEEETKIDDPVAEGDSEPKGEGESAVAQKEVEANIDLQQNDKDTPGPEDAAAAIVAANNDALSASIGKENAEAKPALEKGVKEEGDTIGGKEAARNNLRGSQDNK